MAVCRKQKSLLTHFIYLHCLLNFVLQVGTTGFIENVNALIIINILFSDYEEPRSKLPVGYSPHPMALAERFSPSWSSFLDLAMKPKL